MCNGIKLSPKHGVNPSMELCFWCGEPKGIILCGRLKDDAEAPKGMAMNIEPCDKCKEQFKLGVQIIEVIDDGSKFQNNLAFSIKAEDGKVMWPTGRFVVMKETAIKGGKAGMKMLCTPDVMDRIFANQDRKAEDRKNNDQDPEKEKVEDESVS